MFHAFIGCDTVSFFSSVGMKTCWDVWMSNPEFRNVFLKIVTSPEIISDIFLEVERFVSLMYDLYCRVNGTRKHLFTKRGRMLETIPPTQAALKEHTKRAILQALNLERGWHPSTRCSQSRGVGIGEDGQHLQACVDNPTKGIKNLQ